MAAEAGIIRYVITGEEGIFDIPQNATHVSVHPSVKVISRRLLYKHPNIVELVCHDGVIKIELEAFHDCPRLNRVIMKGVEEVEEGAFGCCEALEYVECDKLEIIAKDAFYWCKSTININSPSAKTVRANAFRECKELKYLKFGHKLESIGEKTFYDCRSLERITLPLKYGLIDNDNTFRYCRNLRHVDLVDDEALQQTIDALLWDEWKNDMNAELISIKQILSNAYAGDVYGDGEKAVVLRRWITTVLRKIIQYKSQHRCLMKEAAYRLQLVLPHDIVMNSVIPFLTLPRHTFDGEDEDKSDGDNESIDEKYSSNVGSDEEEDNQDVSEGGTTDTGEGGKQEGVNDKERRKRQRTSNTGDYVVSEYH